MQFLLTRRSVVALVSATWFASALPSGRAAGTEPEPTYVDLKEKANRSLAEDQHGFEGNNLSEFKGGIRTLGGVKFKVGEKYLSLGSKVEKQLPLKIEGLKLEGTVTKIHFLHGTGYGAYGNAGDELFVTDDTAIGEYVIHYADNTTASVPLVYGKDVRDWWNWDKPVEVSRGKLAWSGTNPFSKEQGQKIHLYLGTWENPKPDVKIVSIDYTSTATTAAAPFCIAITAETKRK